MGELIEALDFAQTLYCSAKIFDLGVIKSSPASAKPWGEVALKLQTERWFGKRHLALNFET